MGVTWRTFRILGPPREHLKLETSNLARRRMAVSSNEKCKIRSKWVLWGSRDPLLEFWDPLISREQLKLGTSKFARRRKTVSSNEKNAKLGQKGSRGCHVTQFSNFYRPTCNADAVLWWEFFLSVCPSVCPSVCHTRVLWQNGRKICPDLYTIRKNI